MDKTVVKTFGLLERLIGTGRAMGVTELAVASGLQKSNVHRILTTLMGLGYVRCGEHRLYEPTLRLWEVGQQIYSRLGIASTARPHLRRMVEATGESGHLAVFDQQEIVYIDRVETPNPVRAYTVVGARAPAYCTASGKALLAHQPPAVAREVAKSLTRHTPMTIKSADRLQRELASIRERGFAVNLGEFRPNVAGLAAPIFAAGGEVLAALGISGPLERMRPRTIKSLAPLVVAAAKDVSQAMGAATA